MYVLFCRRYCVRRIIMLGSRQKELLSFCLFPSHLAVPGCYVTNQFIVASKFVVWKRLCCKLPVPFEHSRKYIALNVPSGHQQIELVSLTSFQPTSRSIRHMETPTSEVQTAVWGPSSCWSREVTRRRGRPPVGQHTQPSKSMYLVSSNNIMSL